MLETLQHMNFIITNQKNVVMHLQRKTDVHEGMGVYDQYRYNIWQDIHIFIIWEIHKLQKHLRVRAEDIKKKINRHDVRIDKRDRKLRSRRLLIDDKGRGTWNYYRWNRKSG